MIINNKPTSSSEYIYINVYLVYCQTLFTKIYDKLGNILRSKYIIY